MYGNIDKHFFSFFVVFLDDLVGANREHPNIDLLTRSILSTMNPEDLNAVDGFGRILEEYFGLL